MIDPNLQRRLKTPKIEGVDVPLEFTWQLKDFRITLFKKVIKQFQWYFLFFLVFIGLVFWANYNQGSCNLEDCISIYGGSFVFLILLFFTIGARGTPSLIYYLFIEKLWNDHTYVLNFQKVTSVYATVENYKEVYSFFKSKLPEGDVTDGSFLMRNKRVGG